VPIVSGKRHLAGVVGTFFLPLAMMGSS